MVLISALSPSPQCLQHSGWNCIHWADHPWKGKEASPHLPSFADLFLPFPHRIQDSWYLFHSRSCFSNTSPYFKNSCSSCPFLSFHLIFKPLFWLPTAGQSPSQENRFFIASTGKHRQFFSSSLLTTNFFLIIPFSLLDYLTSVLLCPFLLYYILFEIGVTKLRITKQKNII